MFNLEKILNKIVKYGLYAILLMPLAFWPGALYGFLTPKFILFQVLVEIVFGAWLVLKIINFRNQKFLDFGNQLFFRRNYIILALSGFFAVSFISAIFGIDFSRSFWGIGARMTGLFAELHFFAWLLVLVNSFSKHSGHSDSKTYSGYGINLYNYLNFSFVISLIIAATAFYQNPDWHLTVYGLTIFNNPTFVAPYLTFHFFWGLYKSIFNFQFSIFKLKGWIFGAATALLGFVIFLGEIRGTILGLFLGLTVFGSGVIFAKLMGRRSRVLISVFFIAAIIGLAGIWFLRESSFVQNTSALKRLTQISLNQATVKTRLWAWQSAFRGFKIHPFFGVGPENFNYVFNANYNPSLLKYSIGETWFDKPHNAFVEILAETGAISILAYILIWFAAAFYLFRQTGDKFLSLALSGAFISYFAAMFFSFDSFGSWFGLFLFLALLASRDNANQLEEKLRIPRIANFYSQLASFAVVFVLLALLSVNFSIWRANLANADALRVFSNNPSAGIELFKKSLSYKTPYKSEYQFDLVASVSGAVEKKLPLLDLENTVNFALDEAYKALDAHPNNAAGYNDMLKIYNVLATVSRDPELLAQAEDFGKKSLKLSPNRQETLFYLARTALLKGDTKSAVELTKSAVNLDSAINASHWYLGLALIADGQMNGGVVEIKKALELGYSFQNKSEENFIKNIGL